MNVSDRLTYTIALTNYSDEDATNVVITDVLPTGLSLAYLTVSTGTTYTVEFQPDQSILIRATTDRLPADGVIQLMIVGVVGKKVAGGRLANTASVVSNEHEPMVSNSAEAPSNPDDVIRQSSTGCVYLPVVLKE